MIRIELDVALTYQVDRSGADLLFHIHPANNMHQAVVSESLTLSRSTPTQMRLDPATGNRALRVRAGPGELLVRYEGVVDIQHHVAWPDEIAEVPVHRIPHAVLTYLYPSRYCQSDRLGRMAYRLFGGMPPGYARVQAIRDWVNQHVNFISCSSDSNTSALDTLIDQAGVCRDFAHLMIAVCRALNIPARMVTGTDYGADPALGPPDFHAYVDVYLGDRWYIFDPSGTTIPMGLVRLATGRDAADVAFATMFGHVRSQAPVIRTEAIVDGSRQLMEPRPCREALSSDAGLLTTPVADAWFSRVPAVPSIRAGVPAH